MREVTISTSGEFTLGRARKRRRRAELTILSRTVSCSPSSLRKAAEDKEKELEDMAKYGGQRRSRKQIFEDEESEGGELEDEEDDLSDDEDEEQGGGEGGDESGEDDEVPSAEDDASMGDDEDADGTPADDGPAQSLEMTQILSSLRSSISSDVTKGLAVKRQLDLFEAVMPVRIRLQKGILAVDELAGREEELKALLEGDDRQGEDEQAAEERRLVEEIQAELKTLSEGLFELRQVCTRKSLERLCIC
jgi:protein AATF/BFR2